jgi:predicted SnoaL-like aldol condensation-catalyzing enzyme
LTTWNVLWVEGKLVEAHVVTLAHTLKLTLKQMSKKLENARNLYLHGIGDGNIELVKEYTGDRYTQHSTGVRDGTEGFMEFFSGFMERTNSRDIQIVRAIVDGDYAFVHVFQNIDNGTAKWITTDLFNFDANDKIVEHWDVIAAYQEPQDTVSGNDMVLGEFDLTDLDKTEANKATVRLFMTDVFQNKNYAALDQYISSEQYIQHNPNMPNGIAAVRQFLQNQQVEYNFVFHTIGQGNYVATLSQVTLNGEALCVFDIFRLANGKIVEHWDNMEPIPPRTEWANTGKF